MSKLTIDRMWIMHYEGPGGEPRYYRMEACELSDGTFQVRVWASGRSAYGSDGSGLGGSRIADTATVAEAEEAIAADRHKVATPPPPFQECRYCYSSFDLPHGFTVCPSCGREVREP